jgi:competence protein ComEC
MTMRRMAIFLGLNVLVSAATTLLVLSLWDGGRSAARVAPTPLPTAAVAPASTPAVAAASTATLSTPVPLGLTSTPGPRTYVVESGDTLSSISRNFNVPVDALLAANNLKDGDLLSIGQQLIIPAGDGTLVATTAPSPTPISPRPVTTQSIALGDAFVTIREITNKGDLSQETVILTNLGGKINLAGWTLADGESHNFTLPDLTLLSNAEVKIHTTSGTNTATDLYWGQSAARWGASGMVAYLRDPTGRLIATYRVP